MLIMKMRGLFPTSLIIRLSMERGQVFPDLALDKVLARLEKEKISYKVDFLDREPIVKNFRKINRYDEVLNIAKQKIDIKNRTDLLLCKIRNSSLEDLENIMRLIDEYYNK